MRKCVEQCGGEQCGGEKCGGEQCGGEKKELTGRGGEAERSRVARFSNRTEARLD